ECEQHADAVVLGEAEEAWPRLLRDFQAGEMKARYRPEKLSDLKGLPAPRYDLLDLKKYRLLNIPSQTTRGCPYACSFCEITQVYGGKFRHRPVEEVIHEIQEIQRLTMSKFIYFVDDNFAANRWAMAVWPPSTSRTTRSSWISWPGAAACMSMS